MFQRLFSSDDSDQENFSSMLIGKRLESLKPLMHKLRVFKSGSEVANMRKAGKISGRAFNMAMQKSFTKENELWAFLEYNFKVGGCERSAYVPVVAGGRVCSPQLLGVCDYAEDMWIERVHYSLHQER